MVAAFAALRGSARCYLGLTPAPVHLECPMAAAAFAALRGSARCCLGLTPAPVRLECPMAASPYALLRGSARRRLGLTRGGIQINGRNNRKNRQMWRGLRVSAGCRGYIWGAD
jgi:hypothetical protein